MSFLVLDLETVPDESVPHEPRSSELARLVGHLLGRANANIYNPGMFPLRGLLLFAHEAFEPSFPPPACWKIACAACVMLDGAGMFESMGIVRGDSEKDIVLALAELVERSGITVVTWNGRRFDVPTFEARCLRHGIALPTFADRWRYRYGDRAHYDLMDYVAGYGAAPNMKLDYVTKLVGLPGKPPETNGSKVEAMIAEGRLSDVQAYCLSDVVGAAGVLLHVEVMRGRLSVEEGRKACATLLEKVEADERVRWMAERTDRKVFLMEESCPSTG